MKQLSPDTNELENLRKKLIGNWTLLEYVFEFTDYSELVHGVRGVLIYTVTSIAVLILKDEKTVAYSGDWKLLDSSTIVHKPFVSTPQRYEGSDLKRTFRLFDNESKIELVTLDRIDGAIHRVIWQKTRIE